MEQIIEKKPLFFKNTNEDLVVLRQKINKHLKKYGAQLFCSLCGANIKQEKEFISLKCWDRFISKIFNFYRLAYSKFFK